MAGVRGRAILRDDTSVDSRASSLGKDVLRSVLNSSVGAGRGRGRSLHGYAPRTVSAPGGRGGGAGNVPGSPAAHRAIGAAAKKPASALGFRFPGVLSDSMRSVVSMSSRKFDPSAAVSALMARNKSLRSPRNSVVETNLSLSPPRRSLHRPSDYLSDPGDPISPRSVGTQPFLPLFMTGSTVRYKGGGRFHGNQEWPEADDQLTVGDIGTVVEVQPESDHPYVCVFPCVRVHLEHDDLEQVRPPPGTHLDDELCRSDTQVSHSGSFACPRRGTRTTDSPGNSNINNNNINNSNINNNNNNNSNINTNNGNKPKERPKPLDNSAANIARLVHDIIRGDSPGSPASPRGATSPAKPASGPGSRATPRPAPARHGPDELTLDRPTQTGSGAGRPADAETASPEAPGWLDHTVPLADEPQAAAPPAGGGGESPGRAETRMGGQAGSPVWASISDGKAPSEASAAAKPMTAAELWGEFSLRLQTVGVRTRDDLDLQDMHPDDFLTLCERSLGFGKLDSLRLRTSWRKKHADPCHQSVSPRSFASPRDTSPVPMLAGSPPPAALPSAQTEPVSLQSSPDGNDVTPRSNSSNSPCPDPPAPHATPPTPSPWRPLSAQDCSPVIEAPVQHYHQAPGSLDFSEAVASGSLPCYDTPSAIPYQPSPNPSESYTEGARYQPRTSRANSVVTSRSVRGREAPSEEEPSHCDGSVDSVAHLTGQAGPSRGETTAAECNEEGHRADVALDDQGPAVHRKSEMLLLPNSAEERPERQENIGSRASCTSAQTSQAVSRDALVQSEPAHSSETRGNHGSVPVNGQGEPVRAINEATPPAGPIPADCGECPRDWSAAVAEQLRQFLKSTVAAPADATVAITKVTPCRPSPHAAGSFRAAKERLSQQQGGPAVSEIVYYAPPGGLSPSIFSPGAGSQFSEHLTRHGALSFTTVGNLYPSKVPPDHHTHSPTSALLLLCEILPEPMLTEDRPMTARAVADLFAASAGGVSSVSTPWRPTVSDPAFFAAGTSAAERSPASRARRYFLADPSLVLPRFVVEVDVRPGRAPTLSGGDGWGSWDTPVGAGDGPCRPASSARSQSTPPCRRGGSPVWGPQGPGPRGFGLPPAGSAFAQFLHACGKRHPWTQPEPWRPPSRAGGIPPVGPFDYAAAHRLHSIVRRSFRRASLPGELTGCTAYARTCGEGEGRYVWVPCRPDRRGSVLMRAAGKKKAAGRGKWERRPYPSSDTPGPCHSGWAASASALVEYYVGPGKRRSSSVPGAAQQAFPAAAARQPAVAGWGGSVGGSARGPRGRRRAASVPGSGELLCSDTDRPHWAAAQPGARGFSAGTFTGEECVFQGPGRRRASSVLGPSELLCGDTAHPHWTAAQPGARGFPARTFSEEECVFQGPARRRASSVLGASELRAAVPWAVSTGNARDLPVGMLLSDGGVFETTPPRRRAASVPDSAEFSASAGKSPLVEYAPGVLPAHRPATTSLLTDRAGDRKPASGGCPPDPSEPRTPLQPAPFRSPPLAPARHGFRAAGPPSSDDEHPALTGTVAQTVHDPGPAGAPRVGSASPDAHAHPVYPASPGDPDPTVKPASDASRSSSRRDESPVIFSRKVVHLVAVTEVAKSTTVVHTGPRGCSQTTATSHSVRRDAESDGDAGGDCDILAMENSGNPLFLDCGGSQASSPSMNMQFSSLSNVLGGGVTPPRRESWEEASKCNDSFASLRHAIPEQPEGVADWPDSAAASAAASAFTRKPGPVELNVRGSMDSGTDRALCREGSTDQSLASKARLCAFSAVTRIEQALGETNESLLDAVSRAEANPGLGAGPQFGSGAWALDVTEVLGALTTLQWIDAGTGLPVDGARPGSRGSGSTSPRVNKGKFHPEFSPLRVYSAEGSEPGRRGEDAADGSWPASGINNTYDNSSDAKYDCRAHRSSSPANNHDDNSTASCREDTDKAGDRPIDNRSTKGCPSNDHNNRHSGGKGAVGGGGASNSSTNSEAGIAAYPPEKADGRREARKVGTPDRHPAPNPREPPREQKFGSPSIGNAHSAEPAPDAPSAANRGEGRRSPTATPDQHPAVSRSSRQGTGLDVISEGKRQLGGESGASAPPPTAPSASDRSEGRRSPTGTPDQHPAVSRSSRQGSGLEAGSMERRQFGAEPDTSPPNRGDGRRSPTGSAHAEGDDLHRRRAAADQSASDDAATRCDSLERTLPAQGGGRAPDWPEGDGGEGRVRRKVVTRTLITERKEVVVREQGDASGRAGLETRVSRLRREVTKDGDKRGKVAFSDLRKPKEKAADDVSASTGEESEVPWDCLSAQSRGSSCSYVINRAPEAVHGGLTEKTDRSSWTRIDRLQQQESVGERGWVNCGDGDARMSVLTDTQVSHQGHGYGTVVWGQVVNADKDLSGGGYGCDELNRFIRMRSLPKAPFNLRVRLTIPPPAGASDVFCPFFSFFNHSLPAAHVPPPQSLPHWDADLPFRIQMQIRGKGVVSMLSPPKRIALPGE
eukprot:gene13569-20903_t